MKPQRIEDVLEFPCAFTFRIVADADDAIQTVCEATVVEITSHSVEETVVQKSRKGNFAVYRIRAMVDSADQIRAVYNTLVNIEGVRTLL